MALRVGGHDEEHHGVGLGGEGVGDVGFEQQQLAGGERFRFVLGSEVELAGENLHGDLAAGAMFAQALPCTEGKEDVAGMA